MHKSNSRAPALAFRRAIGVLTEEKTERRKVTLMVYSAEVRKCELSSAPDELRSESQQEEVLVRFNYIAMNRIAVECVVCLHTCLGSVM